MRSRTVVADSRDRGLEAFARRLGIYDTFGCQLNSELFTQAVTPF